MSKKRIIIGTGLILISILLVWPKPGMEFFNWKKSTLKVIFAVIPLILIGYGIVLSKDHKSKLKKQEITDNPKKEGNEEINGDFDIKESWEASGNWENEGSDIWQGAIKDNKFTMKNGVNTSHFAKKFKYVNIERIEIDLEFPEKKSVEAFIELGTNNSREEIGKLDFERLEESKKIALENGRNEIEPNLNWKDLCFFKIVLHREDSKTKAPIINNVSFKGSKMKDKFVDDDQYRKVGSTSDEEEEMP
ncbi:MAG: hypothetical protein ABEK36_03685, partial [Candidatus Aenigmatarchaeota archaeon]